MKGGDETLEELENSLKVFIAKIRLHLSGTPYRILMGSEFTDEDIIAFYQFTDIADDQQKWDEENLNKDDVKEWDNPYYGFPQMIRFAFNPNESSRKKMEDLKNNGITYAFSALFRPKSIRKDTVQNLHKKFEHESEILDLLEVIDGSKNDENLLGFLDYDKIKKGNMCRHIVCVLPFRASCDALENLIIENKNNNCLPLSNVLVDVWHCDKDGNYSEYGGTQMQQADYTSVHFLRGRQTTNAKGEVSFISIYPGWYQGRAPHVHVEVLSSSGSSLLVTQIAFPESTSSTVYSSTNYAAHGQADTSNTRDNVFADSLASEMAVLTGNLTDGYTLTKTITVNG